MLGIQKKKYVELFYSPTAIKEVNDWYKSISMGDNKNLYLAPFDKIAKGLFTLTSIVQFMMVLMLWIAANEDDGLVSNHVSSAD